MNTIIPDNVLYIGDDAFQGSNGLTSIRIPASVKGIGDFAFAYCYNLTSVTVEWETPIAIRANTFTNRTSVTLYVPEGTKAAYLAADYWKDFKKIVEINPNVIDFADAEVKRICVENWDTDGDGELSEDEAASVQDLGNVFQYNWEITSFDELQYFTGLNSIAGYAFSFCGNLTSITIPENLTSIGNYAFNGCSSLTSITIPMNLTSIGDYAFENCSSLTSVTIPENVTSIGNGVFHRCNRLTTIQVANGNTVYDSRDNCNAIIETASNTLIQGCMNTIIPNSITTIGDNAFYYCSGLTSATIPESVTTISNYAFYGCNNLISIVIPKGVTSIGNLAFHGCCGLTTIQVANGNTVYDSRDNCNAIVETTSNTLILGCMNTIIPNNVTCIGNSAFSGCSSLTSVTIPESVISIGNAAFYDCIGLTFITIPESVTSIGDLAFHYCRGLTSITIPEGVTSIGNSTFYNCSGLTTIAIPESLTSIGDYTFYNCSSLTSVTIPDGVTSIGSSAFKECSSLTSVISYIPDPFDINTNVFTYWDGEIWQNTFTSATLYVPQGTKALYEAAEGWKEFGNIVEIPDAVTVEMSETMATLASPFALDFTAVEGLQACTVTEFDAARMTVKAQPIGQAPGATGLLLVAETASSYQIPVIKSGDVVSGNLLRGTLTNKEMYAHSFEGNVDCTNFILGNGSQGLGFYTVQDGTTLAAGKAYLQLPTDELPATGVKGLRIVIDGGTTDLSTVRNAGSDSEAIYDLSGRRTGADSLKPGLYVRGGKKVLVR